MNLVLGCHLGETLMWRSFPSATWLLWKVSRLAGSSNHEYNRHVWRSYLAQLAAMYLLKRVDAVPTDSSAVTFASSARTFSSFDIASKS